MISLKVYVHLSEITLSQFSKIQPLLHVKTRFNPYVSFWCESHNSHTYPPPDIFSFRIVFFSVKREEKKSKVTLLPWYTNASLPMDVAAACWQYENRTSKHSFQMPHTKNNTWDNWVAFNFSLCPKSSPFTFALFVIFVIPASWFSVNTRVEPNCQVALRGQHSMVKQITSPGWMHETSAQAWCTGKTQRDRVEREVGGGIGMGNTGKPMADSFQCMTKPTTIL